MNIDYELKNLKRKLNIVFLCSGDCDNEIKYIDCLIEKKYIINNLIFVDRLYCPEYKNSNVLRKYPKTKIIFLKDFSDVLNIRSIDLFVSINFQIVDVAIGNFIERKYDLICTFQKLGNLYHETPWMYYEINSKKNKKQIYKGFLFTYLANKYIDKYNPFFDKILLNISNKIEK